MRKLKELQQQRRMQDEEEEEEDGDDGEVTVDDGEKDLERMRRLLMRKKTPDGGRARKDGAVVSFPPRSLISFSGSSLLLPHSPFL